jgi:shikimate dehydrogenase
VHVLNRTPDKARELAADLGARDSGELPDLEHLAHDVIVNTTSVGLSADETPIQAQWIARDAVVMDVVYAPERTRLLREADARGARTIPGKWMLVHQAVAQLAEWAGERWRDDPDLERRLVEIMARAFDDAG